MKDQLLAAGVSYLRHAGTCAAALYMSGITDPKTLANAFLAGLIGPLLRGLNHSDKTFGIK
jgi:hypothetical protein